MSWRRFVDQFVAHWRLLLCMVLAGISYALWPDAWHGFTRFLLSWNVATWAYIVFAVIIMMRATEASIRRHALLGDESRFAILALAVLAAVASIGAIIGQLSVVKGLHGIEKAWHLALVASTLLSAWFFIHLMFTQHYAHEFFISPRARQTRAPHMATDAAGGLLFPKTPKPNFTDFLYFSFVIGVACQTADVKIISRSMRLIALIHGIIAFFFNTFILALTINIAAGLLS